MKALCGVWPNAMNGSLSLTLTRRAVIAGSTSTAPSTYKFPLGSAGELLPERKIWGNDELMNEGGEYETILYDSYGYVIFVERLALCGPSPINLCRLIGFCGQPEACMALSTFGISTDNMFGQPNPGAIALVYTAFSQQVFPQNFSNPNSYGSAGSWPSAPAIYRAYVNGVYVGSATAMPNGTFVFASNGFIMQPDDRFEVLAPDPMDASLSDVAITFVGTRLN